MYNAYIIMFPCVYDLLLLKKDLSAYNNKLFTVQHDIYVQRHW